MSEDKMMLIIDGPEDKVKILKSFFSEEGFEVYDEERKVQSAAAGIYHMPMMMGAHVAGLVNPEIIVALIGFAGSVVVQLMKDRAARKQKQPVSEAGVHSKSETDSDAGDGDAGLHNITIKIKPDAIELKIGRQASEEDVGRLINMLTADSESRKNND